MLSEQDLIDCCELSEEEIEIIVEVVAERENEPQVLCIAHVQALLEEEGGVQKIKDYLHEAIVLAKTQGHIAHHHKLKKALVGFKKAHP